MKRFWCASILAVFLAASFGHGVASADSAVILSPTSLDFGGSSMGTTAPQNSVGMIIQNTCFGCVTSVDIYSVSVSNAQFAANNPCTSVAVMLPCNIQVTFSPAVTDGPLNTEVPVSGTLTIYSSDVASPFTVSLAGTAQKSLVAHYYWSILGRAPDPTGAAFWKAEAARVAGLGANVNEVWYAMAMQFFFSPESTGPSTPDDVFITKLYRTFFSRAPDAGGLAYWMDLLTRGFLPREMLVASFMFSPEFISFTQGIFGNTAARAEVDVVMDFYRGFLARMPDSAGFDYWVQRFRTAQCQGPGAVYAEVESISSQFATSSEYLGRLRNDYQYVGDLYNTFLRRGGDVQGFQFWKDQALSLAMTREQLRRQFIASPEFARRVNAIIAQGCLQ